MTTMGLAIYFRFVSSMSREVWASAAFGIIGLLALVWAAINLRRQEWVAFEPVSGSRGLSVRRTSRTSGEFDSFVHAVTAQIKTTKGAA